MKYSEAISNLFNNPWMVGIVSGLIVAIITLCVARIYEQKSVATAVTRLLDNAERMHMRELPTEAIANCKQAIERLATVNLPDLMGRAYHALGASYSKVALKENKEDNLKEAIEAYLRALNYRSKAKYPREFAMTAMNLSNAYKLYSEVRDQEANLRESLKALEAALTVYTIEAYPYEYAAAMNNVGNDYMALSEVSNARIHLHFAIDAYRVALKVRTKMNYPSEYAKTMGNLGRAYTSLAVQEDKAGNAQAGIDALQEALGIFNIEKSPQEYGVMQNNILSFFRNIPPPVFHPHSPTRWPGMLADLLLRA
jgi:tetratricopeptide (TPR) repeat protein